MNVTIAGLAALGRWLVENVPRIDDLELPDRPYDLGIVRGEQPERPAGPAGDFPKEHSKWLTSPERW